MSHQIHRFNVGDTVRVLGGPFPELIGETCRVRDQIGYARDGTPKYSCSLPAPFQEWVQARGLNIGGINYYDDQLELVAEREVFSLN